MCIRDSQTLVIDQQAEDAVFAQLDRLHAEGARFTAVSEERGVIDYGGGDVFVVIDPLDGSLNAKRGIRSHSLSVAVELREDGVLGLLVDDERLVAALAGLAGLDHPLAARRVLDEDLAHPLDRGATRRQPVDDERF